MARNIGQWLQLHCEEGKMTHFNKALLEPTAILSSVSGLGQMHHVFSRQRPVRKSTEWSIGMLVEGVTEDHRNKHSARPSTEWF
jgi:hypothetical protein